MKLFQRIFFVALCGFLLVPMVSAQRASEVTGVVSDVTGAVLPGVEVVITHELSGVQKIAITNEAGLYKVLELVPGPYQLEAQLPGFKTAVTQVVFESLRTSTVDFTLEVGEISEQVTVESHLVALEKQAPTVSSLIEEQLVQDLPTLYKRPAQLVALAAAVTFGATWSLQPNSPFFSMNGSSVSAGEYYIDGGYASGGRAYSQIVDTNPNLDVTQEVRIVQNSFKAEYSGGGGGLLIMTTKSGTNDIHGSAWMYHRQKVFNARNFFNTDPEPFRQHLWGFTAGGPIKKDKLHLFGSIEWDRVVNPATSIQTLPTLAQRTGDFSGKFNSDGSLRQIFDPASTVVSPDGTVTRTPFPGNIIPSNRLSPIGLNIMDLYPSPNRAPADVSGSQNFLGLRRQFLTRVMYTARVDWEITDKDKFFHRFIIDPSTVENDGPWPGLAGYDTELLKVTGATSVLADRHPTNNDDWVLEFYFNNWTTGWTHTFSPTLVADFRTSYQRTYQWTTSISTGQNWPGQLGIPIAAGIPAEVEGFKSKINNHVPNLLPSGYQQMGADHWGAGATLNPRGAMHWGETISWLRGNHSLKFGAEVKRSFHNYAWAFASSGTYNFDPKSTAAEPFDTASGDSIASMLLDVPLSASTRQALQRNFLTHYLGAFVQDDWRITSNVVLNFGFRYEYDQPLYEKRDKISGFDRFATNPVCNCLGVVTFPETDGFPHGGYFKPNKNYFQPRMGISWNPNGGDTVLRLGAGIFFMPPLMAMGPWGTPGEGRGDVFLSSSLASPDNGITHPVSMASGSGDIPPFDSSSLNAGFGAVPIGENPTLNPTFIIPVNEQPYSQQVSATIQHQLGEYLLEIGWIMNTSHHLPRSWNLNQITPDRIGPNATQFDRPFPQFGNVTQINSPGHSSNYHALILKGEKRFSNGLGFMTNFTWAKHLDNSSFNYFYNRRVAKGPSAQQRRARFVWAGSYQLPFGVQRRYLTDGPLSQVLGGWNMSAAFIGQSGQPLDFGTSPNLTNSFGGSARPNLVGNPEGAQQRTSWWNISAFEHPGAFVFGDAGRGLVPGPGFASLDFEISKDMSFGENMNIRFSAEAFNALNHTNFRNPSTSVCPVDAPCTTNIITGAFDPRRIQLGLKFRF